MKATPLLTRTQAAVRANRDLRTIDRWFESGKLSRVRRGARVYVNQGELDQLITRMEGGEPDEAEDSLGS